MKVYRLVLPLLFALLFAGGAIGLAGEIAQARKAEFQTTSTPTVRSTSTARSTSTPRATRTPTLSATRTQTATPTAEATETLTGTDVLTDSEVLTDTTAITDTSSLTDTSSITDSTTLTGTAVITESEVITGSIIPMVLTDTTEIDTERTLTVVGTGEVTARPDAATLTLGVETIDEDISSAVSENEERIQDVLAAIEDAGIPESDVQTSSYSLFVEQNQAGMESSGETLYHVRQEVTVRLRNLDENVELVGDLISASIDAGANTVFGPNFLLEDNRVVVQRARRAAIEDAYRNAQDWAALTGTELVGIARVSEVIGGGGPAPVPNLDEIGVGGGGNIQAGTLTYSQQVQVVFYIR